MKWSERKRGKVYRRLSESRKYLLSVKKRIQEPLVQKILPKEPTVYDFSLRISVYMKINCSTLFLSNRVKFVGKGKNIWDAKLELERILKGWVLGWSNFKRLVLDMYWYSLHSFLWGSFTWQIYILWWNCFWGKLWENCQLSLKWKTPVCMKSLFRNFNFEMGPQMRGPTNNTNKNFCQSFYFVSFRFFYSKQSKDSLMFY